MSLGGQNRSVRAACDECEWAGESSTAAKRHHEQTGHATHVETFTQTFYGDPIKAWAQENRITLSDGRDTGGIDGE